MHIAHTLICLKIVAVFWCHPGTFSATCICLLHLPNLEGIKLILPPFLSVFALRDSSQQLTHWVVWSVRRWTRARSSGRRRSWTTGRCCAWTGTCRCRAPLCRERPLRKVGSFQTSVTKPQPTSIIGKYLRNALFLYSRSKQNLKLTYRPIFLRISS